MRTLQERLRFARERRGYAKIIEASRAFGWSNSTYTQHENGTRVPREAKLRRYASAYGVSVLWLKFGEEAHRPTPGGIPRVRFAGIIGAGQEVRPSDDLGGEVDALIAAVNGEAFEVVGDSMMPLARPGDTVFFAEPRPLRSLIGRECIVELVDGRRFFKTLERGARDGLYTLISYNSEPIRDCEVMKAGEFLGVRRGGRR